jgi:hypothetical protein
MEKSKKPVNLCDIHHRQNPSKSTDKLLFMHLGIFRTSLDIVTCMSDYTQGLDCWFDLLTTYAHESELQATHNLHNSQITTAPAKPFSACCGFISRSLATACYSGDS